MQLILASQSPRRKALMELFHIPFSILVADIEKFAVKCRTANKEYVVYNKSITYTNVADKGLISIGSEAEQKLIEQLIAIGSKSSYWIGLSWNTEKSRWVWADGNEVYVPNGADCDASDGKYIYGTCYDEFDEAVYDNWNVGQPDNYAPGEDAGMIYGLKDAFGKWNDAPSTSTRDGYITECDIGDRANYKPNGDKNICYAGGIVGFNAPAGKISNCINGANITIDRAYSQNGSIAAAAGGIAGGDVGESGNTALTIWKCYNKGTITAIAKSDSMNGWAFAAAYEICWQLDNTSVVADHVFTGNVCFPTAKSVNDLDKTLQSGNDLNTDTTPVSKTLQYWEHSRLSICFTGDVNEDEQDSDPSGYRNNLQYVVNNTFNEAFFTVNFDGKPVENYVVRYNFLTSGAKLVKITYNNGEYVRTIPVDVAEASPIALTIDENSNHQSTFIQNEIFQANGLVLNLMYNNGSSMTLTAANPEVSVEAPDMSTTGEKLVKVSYAGFTVEYPITVETEGIDLTNAPKIVVSSVSGSAGNTVKVDVVLENNPGVAYLLLTLKYDKSAMTLMSVENGELLKDFDEGVNLQWSANKNVTENGLLCRLTFAVPKSVETGVYDLEMTFQEARNEKLENIKFYSVKGQLIVVDYIFGDANGDGVVNGKDVILLRQYMANYDFSTNTSTVTVCAGADANGDGAINGADVLLLRQYMADFDYDTGKSSVVLGPWQ